MYHFISTLLNANFDVDVSVSNDVAIDVAKCNRPGKVMQGSHCLKVRTLTNENGRYIMTLNDIDIINICLMIFWSIDKKGKIWLSPMTKAPTPTEMSKGQSDNTNNATK